MGWAKNQMMELLEREDLPSSELSDKDVCYVDESHRQVL